LFASNGGVVLPHAFWQVKEGACRVKEYCFDHGSISFFKKEIGWQKFFTVVIKTNRSSSSIFPGRKLSGCESA
jgi:hypothetical protein